MKRNILIKIFIILLAVALMMPVVMNTVFAADETSTTKVHGNTGQRRPYVKNLQEINAKLDKLLPEEKTYLQKSVKELLSAKTADKAAGIVVGALMQIATDSDNVNYKNLGIDAAAGLINLAASCFGFGGVAEAITGPLAAMLKDKEPSEIYILKEHLNEQFEIVNDGIENVRNDISKLSEKMQDSFDETVLILKDAIQADSAGSKVYEFTSSGAGNFDYTLFKNYIYGQTTSNDLSKYAYNNRLLEEISKGSPEDVIEECYNALYKSLTTVGNERMPYINVLRQYVLEDQFGYSIQRYYYDWIRTYRSDLSENGMDAEWEAVSFTLDLYRTLLDAEHCVMSCNNYFLLKIYEEYGANPGSDACYKYVSPQGETTYIKYSDLVADVNNLCDDERALELVVQLVKDAVYILNMDGSYNLGSSDGSIYTVEDSSPYFKNVYAGQTIYMNRLSDVICEMFGFDPQKLTYKWSTGEENDGILVVPNNVAELTATLMYDGNDIYSLKFTAGSSTAFCGGNGTKESPYLIANASQFKMISTGDDSFGKYYKLVSDIDFANNTMSPLGSEDRPFNGHLDGNGKILKNVNIRYQNTVGLFVKVGSRGWIENLTVENLKIDGTLSDMSTVYAGALAGKNEGVMYNCHIQNCKVSVSRNTSVKNQDVFMYVGGLAGSHSSVYASILGCSVDNCTIYGKSYRNYEKEKNKDNENYVYVGGIVGCVDNTTELYATISNCIIDGTTKISAHAISYEKWLMWCDNSPTVEAHAAGIVPIATGTGSLNATYRRNIHEVFVESTVQISAKAESENTDADDCVERTNKFAPISNDAYEKEVGVAAKSDIEIPENKRGYNIVLSYDGETDSEYGCKKQLVYSYDEDFLKKEGLKISVDGKQVDNYEILGYYGLDTLKSDKVDGEKSMVTMLFSTTMNNKKIILSVPFYIQTEKIKCSELIIEQLPKTEYDRNDPISILEGKYVVVWEDGTREYVTPEIISGSTSDFGKSTVELGYGEVKAKYTIEVLCEHQYKEIEYPPTCTQEGYTQNVCIICENSTIEASSIVPKLPHAEELVNYVAPTCVSTGYTGDVYCQDCAGLLKKGEISEKASHQYAPVDGNSCKCETCNGSFTTKPHEYSSVENDRFIIYTCATCKFSYTVEKKINQDITRVVVGNSYGLVGDDEEVVVYIKMFKNPGITGVSFRVEYDERLEYVRHERGELLLSASEFEVAQANGVIGFVAASPDVYGADGNLLKLVFKLPSDAKVMDKYDISIAYTRKQFTNGQADAIDIITMDGCITAVTHLPGDVNNDSVVDVLDTALVARYVAIYNTKNTELLEEFLQNQNYQFSEFYADVNLDGYVDISDLVIMLQYFVGKNVYELTSNEFQVILNPNNGSIDLDSIVVKCYDDEGNKGKYPELPIPVRPGYRFDGWYHSFDVSNLEGEKVKVGDDVCYNPAILKQTLYAHWTEMYTISFDQNAPEGASECSGSMDEMTVAINEKVALNKNQFSINGWNFIGWSLSPDENRVFKEDGEEIEQLANGGETITLYAVWAKKPYTVRYNANKPELGGEISGTMDSSVYSFGENGSLAKNNYSVNGYKFRGWATSAGGQVIYIDGGDILLSEPKDDFVYDLYAVWAVDPFTIGKYVSNGITVSDTDGKNSYTVFNDIYRTPQLTSGHCGANKVIVDWSNEKSNIDYVEASHYIDGTRYGGGNVNLDVQCGIEEVYFVGTEGVTYSRVYIYIVNYTDWSNVDLYFHNFNIKGYIKPWMHPTYLTVSLHCTGNNSIEAFAESIGIEGFKDFTIEGTGSLTVSGGNGSDATTTGGNGSNGSAAIVVDKLTVNMGGSLTAKGGNGGAGCAGASGVSYWDTASTGNKGTEGGAGSNGGAGGNGASAIVATTINAYSQVICYSGNGGSGGRGGDGGRGQNGGHGSNGSGLFAAANGGNGGAGGAGGAGGDGGAKGYTTSAINAVNVTNPGNVIQITGVDGVRGNGGNGGEGGRGGNGGNANGGVGDAGQAGVGGTGGAGGSGHIGGNGGRGGNGGNKGKTNFNSRYYAEGGEGGSAGAGDVQNGNAGGKGDNGGDPS